MAVVSYQAQNRSTQAADAVTEGVELIVQIQNLLSSTKDAETGQRGYLLTGEEAYLEPFNSGKTAIDGELNRMRTLIARNVEQQQRLDQLQAVIADKLSELLSTIELRKAGKSDQAMAIVRTDHGKILMDRIRALVEESKMPIARSLRNANWNGSGLRTCPCGLPGWAVGFCWC